MIGVASNIQLENNLIAGFGIGITQINLTNQSSVPSAIGLVEHMVPGLVPSKLPRLRGVETHDWSIILIVGVSHHTRLIFVGPRFVGVSQAKVVSNL